VDDRYSSPLIIVKVVKVQHVGEGTLSIQPEISVRFDSRWPPKKLLFHGTGKRLLICDAGSCHLLSLPTGAVLTTYQLPRVGRCVWWQHPSEPELVLCFHGRSATIFSWDNIEPRTSVALEIPNKTYEGNEEVRVSPHIAAWASHSPDAMLLITNTMIGTRRQLCLNYTILPTQAVNYPHSTSTLPGRVASEPPPEPQVAVAKALPLPSSLQSEIASTIGILPDNRLVFFDKQRWVCTASLLPILPSLATTSSSLSTLSTSGPATAAPSSPPNPAPSPDLNVKRHFFIPHNWATAPGIAGQPFCKLLRDGTLVVPRNGEVAVMKRNLVQDYQ
jgi:hypothetical protein